MPFKFSDLAKQTKPGVLDLGDGVTINFEFRPNLVTPRFIHDLSQLDVSRMQSATAEQADAVIQSVSEQVARIIASWDVLDADDVTPFPLDVERLQRDFPVQVQVALLMRCMAEMQPGEATAPEKTQVSSFQTSKPSGATS